MLEQGYADHERLAACDLIAWTLQKDPKKRPRSCDEMLRHPFFWKDNSKYNDDSLSQGLHMSRLHIAASLGRTATVEQILKKELGFTLGEELGSLASTVGGGAFGDSEDEGEEAMRVDSDDEGEVTTRLANPRRASMQAMLAHQGELLRRHPLHLAAAGGHVGVVKLLLDDQDVNRDVVDGAGQSAHRLVQRILSNGVGDREDLRSNLKEIQNLLSQV